MMVIFGIMVVRLMLYFVELSWRLMVITIVVIHLVVVKFVSTFVVSWVIV